MRGMRVKNVVRELNNEKIDIIPLSQDAIELLQNALSPIEIRKINVSDEERVISIVVDDDQFATVVGKRHSNQRLNGDLIGYTLEVHGMTDYNLSQVQEQSAYLSSLSEGHLDKPIETIEGVNQMIVDQLKEHGFEKFKDLLMTTPQLLSKVPGISLESAEKIIDSVKKQGKASLD